MRQQRRERRPVRWLPRVAGQRGLDQGGGSLLPLASRVRRYLGEGNGLDQAVHQHSVPIRGDQRVAAQRGDRIPHSYRITQQRPDRVRHSRCQLTSGTRIGEQQGQRCPAVDTGQRT